MKIVFGIILSTLSFSSYSQTKREMIAKGDNIITIDSKLSADSAFLLCSKYLIQKGYSFESRDASLGQLVTNQRSYAGAFNYKLNMVFRSNEIKIRVLAQVMTLGQQIVWEDWSYAKARGNLFNDAFLKFQPDVFGNEFTIRWCQDHLLQGVIFSWLISVVIVPFVPINEKSLF